MIRKLLFVLLSIVVLGGCTQEPPLRIGSNRWPGYEPLYLARERGYFDNSAVRLVELPSSTDVIQYLRNGSLEGGALTLDEVLSLCAQGIDLRIVLVLDVSNGGDLLLARPGIDRLADLVGKRIGVESTGVGAILLHSALEAAGIPPERVTLVPLTLDEHEEAFLQGRVDALVTFEPVRTKLLQRGAKVLYDSRRMPNPILDVLAVRRQALTRNPIALRTLVRGYFRARHFMETHPQEATKLMAPRLAMKPGEFSRALTTLILPTLADNHRWLAGDRPKLRETAERLLDFMSRHRLIAGACPVQSLATPDFLPAHDP